MLTINYKGKNYKWKGNMYGTREIHNIKLHGDIVMLETGDVEIFTRKTPNDLVSEGYMEEVKENKENITQSTTFQVNTDDRDTTVTRSNSILEKLREELIERKKEYENKLSTKKITKQTADDKILLIRINEIEIVILLLTSLEQPKEETIHIPPVSEDGKGVNKSQPQEDIELPEFDYDKLHIEAMEHGVTFAVHVAHQLCKQVELLTNIVNQLIKANKKLGK